MENYVLYDEIGRGSHSVVYKGRKRGTIEFVAIHCVEKYKRLKLQNIVRLTHELDHDNVVRFCEWYETTNHIWMVVELCTGDSLDTVLVQDKVLPEDTVRGFGVELAKGLFYIHSLSILYCDLRPSRIMTDGAGVLKLSNFGLARVEGEDEFYDLDESNSGSDEEEERCKDTEGRKSKRPKASPYYLAPEVLAGGPHTKESDLYSLGCVLFELYTGEKPFLADSFPELVTKIFHEECPGMRQSTEEGFKSATGELSDLVKRLLTKDPQQRLRWSELVRHKFWGGSLDALLKSGLEMTEGVGLHDEVCSDEGVDTEGTDHLQIEQSGVVEGVRPSEDCEEKVEPTAPEQTGFKQGTYTFSSRPRNTDAFMNHSHSQILGETQVLKKDQEPNRTLISNLQTPSDMVLPKDRTDVTDDRPESGKSAINLEKNGKAGTRVSAIKGKIAYSRQKTVVLKGKDSNTSQSLGGSHVAPSEAEDGISNLIHHPSDFVVTPIADNPKIKKVVLAKWDPKALPCHAVKAEELLKLSEEKLVEHLSSILTLLSQGGKQGGGSVASLQRSKLHTASYLASLCRDGEIGNIIFESELITGMLKQIKSGFSADFKARLGVALGLLAGNATLISENFDMTEVFTILTEVIRDNFRNSRLKQHLLPALGEFLFYAATQEENEGHQIPEWDVPGVTFTIIARCLREGEDIVVQHFAAKTIENVASTHGRHMEKFATNDTAQLLWNLFTHCTVDIQKVTAISALCRLTCQAPAVFHHVIEKAGFKAVLAALSSGVTKVQQAAVTMFAIVLSTRPQARRLIQERDLIPKVMHLLESSSVVIRAKAFLMVLTLVQTSKEALLSCCQSRLVMFIEREMKRTSPMKGESPDNHAYLMTCLNQCVSTIVSSTPDIVSCVLSSLGAVEGRRHPSAVQAKQLRTHLPLLSIILHLVTSHVFRPQILTDQFLADLGAVLRHVKSIDAGSTCIGTAAGPNAAEDMTSVVLSIVEAVTQHPALVRHRHAAMVEHILPSLAALVSSSSGDTRVLCFRMFSEMTALFLDDQNVYDSSSASDLVLGTTQKLDEVVRLHLLPQYHLILGDQDPLPAYGLKFLLSFLERSPDIIRTFLAQGLLGSLSQILQSHAGGMSTGMTQSMVGLLDCVTSGKEVDMPLLFEQGLIESVTSLFVDVTSLLNEGSADSEHSPALLLPLLDTVNNILKFVSREVRKALLAKNEGGGDSESAAQFAESLLVESKPLTELTGLLINFLCHDDADVQDSACKCLYLVAELYGGVHEEAFSVENLECFAEALNSSDLRRQKQLLRVVKRLIASNAQHVHSVVNSGQMLVGVLQRIKDATDSSSADSAAVQSLAQEVWLKLGLVT